MQPVLGLLFFSYLVIMTNLLYNEKVQIDWEEQHDSINRIFSIYDGLFSL